MTTLDRLVRADDYLCGSRDIPREGVLCLCELPLSEPRYPAMVQLNGRCAVVVLYRIATPDAVLLDGLAALAAAGVTEPLGFGGLTAAEGRALLRRAQAAGALCVLDAPLGIIHHALGVEICE